MLSYPDSELLKELDYPQELKLGDWYYGLALLGRFSDEPRLYYGEDSPEITNRDYVKVPTTDGMIEGLGREFVSLHHHPDGGFWAEGLDGVMAMFARTQEQPDQALCELWKETKTVPSSE